MRLSKTRCHDDATLADAILRLLILVLFCPCKEWHNMRQGRGNLGLGSLKMRLDEALALQTPYITWYYFGAPHFGSCFVLVKSGIIRGVS